MCIKDFAFNISTNLLNTQEYIIQMELKNESLEGYCRLHRVLGYMFCYDSNVISKIEKMVDIHGDLEIYWKEKPSKINILSCSEAWNSIIGDTVLHIEHYFNNTCLISFREE